MNQLIDGEQTSGGTWHYWWHMADGTIRVSRSNSPSTGGTLVAGVVRGFPLAAIDIAGIGALTNSNPNVVVTWWQQDSTGAAPLTWSTNDLDLLQAP
jgi:hypothetical protein